MNAQNAEQDTATDNALLSGQPAKNAQNQTIGQRCADPATDLRACRKHRTNPSNWLRVNK